MLEGRIRRAARILQPFTHKEVARNPMDRAINDAFMVLEWGRTVEEDEAHEAARQTVKLPGKDGDHA